MKSPESYTPFRCSCFKKVAEDFNLRPLSENYEGAKRTLTAQRWAGRFIRKGEKDYVFVRTETGEVRGETESQIDDCIFWI